MSPYKILKNRAGDDPNNPNWIRYQNSYRETRKRRAPNAPDKHPRKEDNNQSPQTKDINMEKPYNNDKGIFKSCIPINDTLFHSNHQTSLKGGVRARKGGVWGQVPRMDCKSDLGSR